jgi:predicted aldo/keto reductase-like oxidoreductase
VLIGFDNPAQVPAAVAYETATDEEKDYASVLASAPRHAYKGQCTYCGHCKPCPMHIDIAMVNKLYDLATMQDFVPDSVRAHYEGLEAHAGDCIGCKACEARCPFGVKIAERMVKCSKVF